MRTNLNNRISSFLDTLALAQFVNGKKAEAVATQTKVVEMFKAEMEKDKRPTSAGELKYFMDRLEEYQKAL